MIHNKPALVQVIIGALTEGDKSLPQPVMETIYSHMASLGHSDPDSKLHGANVGPIWEKMGLFSNNIILDNSC